MANLAFESPCLKFPLIRKNIESANIIWKCRHKVYIWDDYYQGCENSLILSYLIKCLDINTINFARNLILYNKYYKKKAKVTGRVERFH